MRLGVGLQNHQIDQLKEEISGKDLALVKEHFDHMKVGAPILCHAPAHTDVILTSPMSHACIC